MDKVFSQKGGVRLDAFNVTWPFAEITASSESIKISVFWKKKYILNKKEIIGLKKYRGMFSEGLLIEHQRKDCPHHMVFWSFNLKSLIKGIEAFGYLIGEPKK